MRPIINTILDMMNFTTKDNKTNENFIRLDNKTLSQSIVSTNAERDLINIATMRLGKMSNIVTHHLDKNYCKRFGYASFFNINDYNGLLRAFKVGNRYVIDKAIERSNGLSYSKIHRMAKQNLGIMHGLSYKIQHFFYSSLIKAAPKDDDFYFALKIGKILHLDKKSQIDEWASNGRLDFLKRALELMIQHQGNPSKEVILNSRESWDNPYLLGDITTKAALDGNLLIVEWGSTHFINGTIKASSPLWEEKTCESAALNGHNDLVRWLLKKKFKTGSLCVEVSKHDDLVFLKECRSSGCSWCSDCISEAIIAAANKGHLNILTYLINDGGLYGKRTCEAAAGGGHLDILKYLREISCEWDIYTLLAAIRNEHYNLLRWAMANGCLPTVEDDHEISEMLSLIFEKGEISLLKEFKQYGFFWDENTFSKAVMGQNIETVKYFGMNGCPFNKNICIVAANSRFLQVFQWCIFNTNYDELSAVELLKLYIVLSDNGTSQLLTWFQTNILSKDKLESIKAQNVSKEELIDIYWILIKSGRRSPLMIYHEPHYH